MVLHLSVDKPTHTDFTPRITVFGVGGAGGNAARLFRHPVPTGSTWPALERQ